MDQEDIVGVVGQNLRRLREYRGLTLSNLAELSGIAKATLSNLETGRGNPTLETLFALSHGLGFPLGEIIAAPRKTQPTLVRAQGVPVMSGEAVDLRFYDRFGAGQGVTEIYDMSVRRGKTQRSMGHPGIEHICVKRGVLITGPVASPVELSPGDYVSFSAEVEHFYKAVKPVESSLVIHYPGPVEAPTAVRNQRAILSALEH